ncbi:uncharacterized protein LOC133107314 [Conger conger]|uniref:uncharacterized protein LOC133107314 n=1 Tax=Conger conger TaxID=82655 RepID=UPI002A5AA893|nr:uncharacterized protein LOC133107314 [Conger conger]
MWRLTLLCLFSIRRVSPALSVGNLDGPLSGHATDPEGVAENAWYPGVSLLGPVGGPSSNPLAMPSDPGAVVGGSADLELEVWCLGGQLTLGVRATPGGAELNRDALTLGDGCESNGLSVDYLWFTYDLTECGTRQSVLDGDVVYSNVLQYAPEPSSSVLQQVEAFSLPVYCTLDRNQGPVLMSVPVSTKSLGPGFSLRAMNGSWTGLAESVVFRWGEAIRLQAAVGRVGEEQRLYVPSCHATATPDPKSRPRVRLIMKKGCVAYVVSQRGRARFVPSERTDAVNFLFAAFSLAAPEIYLHCELAVLGQEMTPASKFCNYNQRTQRWEELSGDIAVCGCCRTQCPDPAPNSAPAGLRALVTVGPLVVESRGAAEPEAAPPTAPPVARATTPAPPGASLPTAFPEPSPPGFPAFPAQAAWAGPLSPEDVAVLDGFPVPDAPPGWVTAGSTRVTWVYPPAPAHGGVLVVRRVPGGAGEAAVGRVPVGPLWAGVRGPAGASHSLDDEGLWRSYHDDPSAHDVWGQGTPPPPVSDPDPLLEESGRKRWGLALGALARLRSEPADREAGGSRRGDAEVDPLAEVGLEGEGLVVQRTEVIRHKGPGRPYPEVLSALRSRLALTRSEGAAQKLRYEEEEQGQAQEEGVMKRRVLLEEDNVRPSSLRAVLRRMYKAE